MSEINDLENRISAAMDRIGRGVEALAGASASDAGDPTDLERLERALEDEKLAGAQLEERVKALLEKQDTLEASVREAKAEAEAAKADAESAKAALAEAEGARDAALSEKDGALGERDAAVGERDAARAALAEAEANLTAAREAEVEAVPAVSDEDLAASREAMEDLALRMRRMRRLGRNLRENNQRLREAAEKGVSDPELINASLKAELENLSAWREADQVETDVILSGLRPLLNGATAPEAANVTADHDAGTNSDTDRMGDG